MSAERIFGNWMVALAEAAEVAGAKDLDAATGPQLAKAWNLLRTTADITAVELNERMAKQARIEVAELDGADVRICVLVPAEVAHRRNVLPLRCTDREVVVATGNPFGEEARREIASLTGRPVTFQLAAPDDLAVAIQRAYGQAPEATDAPHWDAPLSSGPHVLVVDDEAGQRALFRSILEGGGCRVTVARDGPEAVKLLRGDTRLDLVTLDYWMDKMNGLRVLQQIRSDASLATMPVIMVTGADDRRIEMSLFEAGADDFVAKPVDAPLFMLRVQAVLRRKRYA